MVHHQLAGMGFDVYEPGLPAVDCLLM